MRFFSPWALLLGLTVPGILAMWFLKLKGQEQRVSSNMIWKRVERRSDLGEPFDRLKKSLLLYLQILAALLIMFAAMNPYVDFFRGSMTHYILVLDNSGSMSGLQEKETLLSLAKTDALKQINGAKKDSVFTIIEARKAPETILVESKDKSEAARGINGLRPFLGTSDLEGAMELARGAAAEMGGKIFVYSDRKVDLLRTGEELRVYGSTMQNAGITRVSLGDTVGETVIVSIKNYGTENRVEEVSVYSDEVLSDTNTVEIKGGEGVQLLMKVQPGTKRIRAEMNGEDRIKGDDTYYFTPGMKTKKIGILGRDSIFLEKVIGLIPGVTPFKIESEKNLPPGYDLYVFESLTEEEILRLDLKNSIPNGASALFIGNGGGVLEPGEKIGSTSLRISGEETGGLMEGESFVIREGVTLADTWGTSLAVTEDNKSLINYGEQNSRRVGYIGFHFGDSDFPLNPSFPIVIDKLIRYGAKLEAGSTGPWVIGDSVQISMPNEVKEATLSSPSGGKEELTPKGGATFVTIDEQPGIYVIHGKGEKEFQVDVPVNFPEAESLESDIAQGIYHYDGKELASSKGSPIGKYLRNGLIFLLFIGLLAEGEVYRRGL